MLLFLEGGKVVGSEPRLTIPTVNRTSSGAYRCKATNSPQLGEESNPLSSDSTVKVEVLCKLERI